jgi:hypothetical protein
MGCCAAMADGGSVTDLPQPELMALSCYARCFLVLSSWTLGWRLRKVDRTGVSTAGNVATVIVLSFGHLGDKEQTTGSLVVAALRQRHLPDCVLKIGLVTEGGLTVGVDEGFSGRKLHVSTPTTVTPLGAVTLLGALLWVPSLR